MQRNAIILAAGKGTRMKSEKNKVMHELIDQPILAYVLDALKQAQADRILIVAGYKADSLKEAFPQEEFALQKEQLGTGHAVMQCQALENEPGLTMIINGDVPCLSKETLEDLYTQAKDYSLVLLSAVLEDGGNYGRIVRDESGQVLEIVEAKDCSEDQRQIREINAGVYCFNNRDLFDSLSLLTTNNSQNEYYLTDLVKILNQKGKSVRALPAQNPQEMAGINTVSELSTVYRWLTTQINEKWLDKGVQIVDPTRTMIGPHVQIGHDVVIYPDVELLGHTVIGDYCTIYPHTWIKNATVKANSSLQNSVIEDCVIPEDSQVIGQCIKQEGKGN